MSSILELFEQGRGGDPNGAPSPSNLDAALNQVMADRAAASVPRGTMPEPGAPASPDPTGSAPPPVPPVRDGGEVTPPPPVEPASPAPTPPAAPVHPFADLSPVEQAELEVVRQALMDPERRRAIQAAYLGVATPAAGEPPAPSAPALPDEIDPDSFEAKLWRAQQEQAELLARVAQSQQAVQQQTEEQRARSAAQSAGRRFTERYGTVLTQAEIEMVARTAGSLGLPQAFAASNGGDIDRAMDDSLEFALRRTDALLARVLGAVPSPSATAPAFAPQVPAGPPQVSPNVERQRVLTALSTGASPAGETAPQRPALEHRPGDGRLTEASRSNLVEEIVASMRGGTQGA